MYDVMSYRHCSLSQLKIHTEPKDFTYLEGPWGAQRLRDAMAAHINRHFHPKEEINADRLLFANGVTAICEMIAFSICDIGDGVLFSRPIYQAFKHDFGTRAKFALSMGIAYPLH